MFTQAKLSECCLAHRKHVARVCKLLLRLSKFKCVTWKGPRRLSQGWGVAACFIFSASCLKCCVEKDSETKSGLSK